MALVRESIQNFQRGLEPIQSMGVGLEQVISEFMKEKTSSSPEYFITYLLTEGTEEELDNETRKKWIEFLIKFPKYNNGLDENDYYELKERGIKWIPYVPLVDSDFSYEVKGDKFFLSFSEWNDFTNYFEESRDLDRDFIGAVLSGDAHDFFNYDYSNFRDITDFTHEIEKMEKTDPLSILETIRNMAIKMGADPEDINTTESLFYIINENEDLDELRSAIQITLSETAAIADEEDAFKELVKTIRKEYDMGETDFVNKNYIAEISLQGLEKLSYTLATNDEKIVWYPPRDFDGEWDKDTFENSLENRLDDIDIEEEISESYLNESPDEISLPYLKYNRHGESIDNDENISPGYESHDAHGFYIDPQFKDLVLLPVKNAHPFGVRRTPGTFSGRLWKNKKIISFWEYPDRKTYKFMIDGINKELEFFYPKQKWDIMNDPEWKIEILPQDIKTWKNKINSFKTKLIPLRDYMGSAKRSEDDLSQEHIKSPLLKQKRVPRGWGSTSPKYKEHRAWQMASLTSESKS
jgi:hypothetical protein